MRRYVETTGCLWFTLSAKYGLVAPNQMLTPYEQTLNTMGIAERRAWAHNVQAQMDRDLPQGGRTKQVLVFVGD